MDQFEFNDPVEATCVLEPYIGRLVQIRQKAGQFGSDLYLIRLKDGKLMTLENVGLRKYTLEELPIFEGDSPEREYTIRHELPMTGFMV